MDQFSVLIIDHFNNIRSANSFNTSSWTHPVNGTVTVGMNSQILNTIGWAHGDCHLYLFNNNNPILNYKK